MRHEVLPLEVPASVAAGTAIRVDRHLHKVVQVFGTFAASVDIEGSLNGTNFSPLVSGVTAPGLFTINAGVKWLRLNTTAWTSGAPQALIGGFDSRTDGG